MVAVHARMLLASLPSRIFEQQAGIGVPFGCTTELRLVSSAPTDVIKYSGTQLLGPDRGPVAIGAACATAYLHAAQRKAQ